MRPIEDETIYSAWVQAIEHLLSCPENTDFNVILQINNPMAFEASDRNVREIVNTFLTKWSQPLDTVAQTIFPLNQYYKNGVEGVYTKYPEVIYPKIKSEWGFYAYRLVRIQDGDKGKDVLVDAKTGQPINPLGKIIEKLKNYYNNPKKAIYELNTINPVLDIPLYRASHDRCYTMGGPCLSHISFKVVEKEYLSLTAFYRSHYYIQRALGNLMGLTWLLYFACKESGFKPAQLTCISSMAKLESKRKGWTKPEMVDMITNCKEAVVKDPHSNKVEWVRRDANSGEEAIPCS